MIQAVLGTLILGKLFTFGVVARAQTTNQGPAIRNQVPNSAVPKVSYAPKGTLTMMKQTLSLSEDQVQKLQPILKDHQGKITALRHDTSLSHADKSARMRETESATSTKVSALLTPEQAQKWKKGNLSQPQQAAHSAP